MTLTTEELRERVLQFKTLRMPGQPMAMHMGTSYLVSDLERAILERDDENAALRAEVERLRPWARLGVAVMEGCSDTFGDIDGFWLQDMAVGAGVLRDIPGGFDPARHVDDLGVCPERGDPWFEIIRRPSAAALGEGGE